MGEGADGSNPLQSGREVASRWLVVSGPSGSKVTEILDGEIKAAEHAQALTARGVEAEVRELVTLAYPVGLRIDVERKATGDATLISALLAKALLRAANIVLDAGLQSAPSGPAVVDERPAPRIVVPRLVPRMGRGRRG